ncbi:MAG: hypothetical protein IPH93_10420 [Saprospiraceae bacterium]|nr:hypothetical protein [Saprospiraceae bacterium]
MEDIISGGYSWIKDNNQGRNWLVKTDSLGCDDVSCLDTAVEDPTEGTDEVWLYPNPVRDQIHIASPGGFRVASLRSMIIAVRK